MRKRSKWSKHYKMGPMFNPEVVSKVDGPIAAMGMSTGGGGTNWPGGGYDPETHIVFAQASNSMGTLGLVQPPPGYGRYSLPPRSGGPEIQSE